MLCIRFSEQSPRARLKLSDRRHGIRRDCVRYSNMVVWFCARHIDHKPNTPFFRCLSAAWGRQPMRAVAAHRGNRIGGHKNRSFLYGTVRPRGISECGNMNNPRPLAYEACLKKTCADSASLDAMESASWHRKPLKKKKKDQKLSEHFT